MYKFIWDKPLNVKFTLPSVFCLDAGEALEENALLRKKNNHR